MKVVLRQPERLAAAGVGASGARPPEPHPGQESYSKRQLVGFSMASERRRRVPLAEMSGFGGRNGTRNGTRTPTRPSHGRCPIAVNVQRRSISNMASDGRGGWKQAAE